MNPAGTADPRLMPRILVANACLVIAGCGNNRIRSEWEPMRDVINQPLR